MRTKLYYDKHPEDWELKRLLAGINLRSTWGKRTYLLILFICHTGLRIGELTRLTVADVVWGGEPREEVFLSHRITKGKKSRVVPLAAVDTAAAVAAAPAIATGCECVSEQERAASYAARSGFPLHKSPIAAQRAGPAVPAEFGAAAFHQTAPCFSWSRV